MEVGWYHLEKEFATFVRNIVQVEIIKAVEETVLRGISLTNRERGYMHVILNYSL